MRNSSNSLILAALIAVVFLGLGAVLMVAPGGDAQQRLALFFGLVGLIVPALLGALKADQAASNTNGKLDARIQAAVHRANNARRVGDVPATADEIDRGDYHQ